MSSARSRVDEIVIRSGVNAVQGYTFVIVSIYGGCII